MSDKKPDYLYGVNGELSNVKDEDSVYAMKKWNGRYYDFYIRRAMAGPDRPHLLNPWGMNFEIGVSDKKYEPHLGKRTYEFSKVSEEVMNYYINFLTSRNEMYLRAAERACD